MSLLLLFCINSAEAQPSPGSDHAEVSMRSQQSAVPAGSETRIGFHFDLEEGWHTYWQNPGDSGIPARISFTLDDGFKTGNIKWPWPEIFEEGHLITYGYKDQVMLMVPVQVSYDTKPGRYLVNARLEYLVCKDVCLPAFESHQVEIEVVSSTAEALPSEDAAVFEYFLSKIPVETDVEATFSRTGRDIELYLDLDQLGKYAQIQRMQNASVYFYGLQDDAIEPSAPQQLRLDEQGFAMILQQSRYRNEPLNILEGILTIKTESGMRALEIKATERSL
ncbi:MAG: hypothetical protein LAT67_12505 [Balneolales bacterium]|nr:hypothetical protein [Balneolales bacterium]